MLYQIMECDKCKVRVQRNPCRLKDKASCMAGTDWVRNLNPQGWTFGKHDLCPTCSKNKKVVQ